MDQQGHGQSPAMGVVSSGAQMSYAANPYQPNQMIGDTSGPIVTSVGSIPPPGQPAGYSTSPAQLAQHQLAYQHIHQQQQQQLQQQLQTFWANQYQEIEQTTDFKNHSLPLARIKKIMKADEDVRMIAAEAPVIFARACEMFILELTLRSWNHTEENKRRTLQKNDIAAAITRTDIFDFLVDIVPREDLKDEVLASIPRGGALPVGGAVEPHPYYYIPQHSPQVGTPGMIMGKPVIDQALYAQQPRPYMAPQMWPQASQQQQQQQQQLQQEQDHSDS
ncbi:Nuclear transcription factor y subunit c [Thalictrum thalictroides]|uniref:Nuclear transcription factor y subunit c n=1 Tax=Thalictrum thalictroides TaxID=46969 RepID=A0A7J6XGT6_THATH|nr:Nuclear transcription factor y subunit c [Thalictrum thalictroides]